MNNTSSIIVRLSSACENQRIHIPSMLVKNTLLIRYEVTLVKIGIFDNSYVRYDFFFKKIIIYSTELQ